jgi:phosphate:Na+ symporter
MIRKILFVLVLIALAAGFYLSQDFQIIATGVAILLFGMKFLENGFESIAYGALYKVLQRVSNNFWLSFLIGLASTAVLQSSSLVTIIAIAFISGGSLSLRSGLGILFGSNLGTTSTAWIVAYLGFQFNISTFALPMIVFGIIFLSRKAPFQNAFGNILLGLGGFFMGIYAIQSGFSDLQEQAFFIRQEGDGLIYIFLAVLSGIILTGILQSSSATMAIVITALGTGQISYVQSLAMAIGANIGTTSATLLGSLSSKVEGRRLAYGHLIFNVVTGILAFFLLPLFMKLIDESADLLEINQSRLTIELAMFHSVFNLFGIIMFLPFTGMLERLLTSKIKNNKNQPFQTKYLQPSLVEVPSAAYSAIQKEISDMFKHLMDLIEKRLIWSESLKNKSILEEIYGEEPEDILQIYYDQIKPVLAEIQHFAAVLSTKTDTSRFSIVSRLVAEIVRDFAHFQKDAGNKQLMANRPFRQDYEIMILHILKTIQLCRLAEEKIHELGDQLQEQANTIEDFNKFVISQVNRNIAENNISAMMGTTLMHNADYTKRIVKKIIRASRLIYEERFLETEASGGLDTQIEI